MALRPRGPLGEAPSGDSPASLAFAPSGLPGEAPSGDSSAPVPARRLSTPAPAGAWPPGAAHHRSPGTLPALPALPPGHAAFALPPRQRHPALSKSSLPPSHLPKRARLGTAFPSHEEVRFVPGDGLDCRLRQAAAAARAARRTSVSNAPSRLSWRPPTLRRTSVAPRTPVLPRHVPASSADVRVAHVSPGTSIPIPALPALGRQVGIVACLPPPPVSPAGLRHGTLAYGAWVADQARAAKRPLSPVPVVHLRGRRVRQRCVASS